MLERERARSDRSGLGFSLVVFGVAARRQPGVAPLARVARAALKRARVTDEIGWFDDGHVAAMLPDTTLAGARRFAHDVCAALAAGGIEPAVRVYGYGVSAAPGTNAATPDTDSHRHDGDPAGPHRRRGDAHEPAPSAGQTSSAAVARRGAGPAGVLMLELPAPVRRERAADAAAAEPRLGLDPALAGALLNDVESLLAKPLPVWKRALDLIGASTALILFSPVMIVAALAVKFGSKGPVIFRQPRAGLGGKTFTMYKFRSMVVGAEAQQAQLRAMQLNEQDGPAFKLKNDPRVTRIGKFLRKTSLDELPQLFNVLKGEMTLVGPRPLPVKESDDCEAWHRRRLDVTPGLTCVWQVEGRSQVFFDEWMRMDLDYIRRRSLWTDLSLIARTIPAVLLRRGAR